MAHGAIYRLADLEIDTSRRLVARGGEIVALPRLTYRLLLVLLEAAPALVTSEEIVERVWNGRATSPETITQRVKLLRDALGDDAASPRYIGVVRAQGYRLLPPVTRCAERGPGPVAADLRAPHAARRMIGVWTGAAAALLLAVGFFATQLRPTTHTLAVLPFEDLTGLQDQAYLVEGLGDALISELARLPRVDVIARGSSMRSHGPERSMRDIGDLLGATALIVGSVQRSSDRLTIVAHLIDAESSVARWSQTLDIRLEELPWVQWEIADAIGAELGVLSETSELRRPASREVDPATYEAYLRGMHALNKASPADIETGLAYLHEATRRNPGDARAWAGLALGYATFGHGLAPRHDVWPRARAAAERALRLDPTLAEAHAAIADYKLYSEWDWDGAEAAFQRANELNPSLAMNHYHYAWYLALFGRLEEAIAKHERARELDPLTPLHTFWLGMLYLYDSFDRADEAIAVTEEALALDPGNPMALVVRGLAEAAAGENDAAVATLEQAADTSPPVRPVLGFVHALVGQHDRARAILAELEAQPPTPWLAYWQFAINARLGNLDAAFEWLAYEPHHAFVAWARVDPWLRADLGRDPRFYAFLDRLGTGVPAELSLAATAAAAP